MARVLVIGSVARDEVFQVQERLRPGTHGHARPRGVRLGGGGAAFALPLAASGHVATLAAPLGDDDLGEQMLAELTAAGIDTSQVVRCAGPSTRSIVLTDEVGERTILNVHRCREAAPPERLRPLDADYLYVRSRAHDLAPLLRELGQRMPVVAHVPPCEAGSRPARILVGSASDLPPDWLREPWPAGRAVAGPALEWVIITRGAQGASAHGRDADRLEIPAPAVEVVDSTGAGDVFAAGLVHALLEGLDMAPALARAVAWGTESTRWECSGLPARALARLLTDGLAAG